MNFVVHAVPCGQENTNVYQLINCLEATSTIHIDEHCEFELNVYIKFNCIQTFIQLNFFLATISFQHVNCDYLKNAITANRMHNVRRVRLYIQILANTVLLNATGDFVPITDTTTTTIDFRLSLV